MVKATGGNIVKVVNGRKIHIFTSSGNFNLIDNPDNVEFEYLIVGGGGGGGSVHVGTNRTAGGGGAGGVIGWKNNATANCGHVAGRSGPGRPTRRLWLAK